MRPEHVELSRKIGEGASSTVYSGVYTPTGTKVAVKVMKKKHFEQKLPRRRLKRELKAMCQMEHPNICQLYGLSQTESHYCLILQFAENGDLLERLRTHGPFREEKAGFLFGQLISAVHHMHSRGFVHRDIKPENLFLDGDNNLLLGDFGFANRWNLFHYQADFCGSLHYAAPEVICHGLVQGPEADVWSCGAVLLALVTAQLPFSGIDQRDLIQRVTEGRYNEPPCSLSPELHDLLRKMMEPNSLKRLTVKEVMEHPWVRRYRRRSFDMIPIADEEPCTTNDNEGESEEQKITKLVDSEEDRKKSKYEDVLSYAKKKSFHV
jgi:serine/threonine protein kinase